VHEDFSCIKYILDKSDTVYFGLNQMRRFKRIQDNFVKAILLLILKNIDY